MGRQIITKNDVAKIKAEFQALAQFRQQQGAVAGAPGAVPEVGEDQYKDKLLKFIPADIIAENVVSQFVKRSPRPIVVAAAGNYGDQELAYPARFGDVLAIGSITSTDVLSSGCNRETKDQAENPHRNHFVLPGGESDPARPEPVLTSAGGQNWSGTSFAAGFASGLIARLLGTIGMQHFGFDAFVDGLRQSADKNLPNYSMAEHGNGLMHA